MLGSYVNGYSGDGGPATSALLNTPSRVGGDTTGLMYVLDTYSAHVRTVSSGIITNFGGTGVDSFFGDNMPFTSMGIGYTEDVAIDPDNGDVYVSSRTSNRVFVVTKTTALASTFAGSGDTAYTGDIGDGGAATSAALREADGMFRNTLGYLYVNQIVHRVRGIYASSPTSLPSLKPSAAPSVVPTIAPSLTPTLCPSREPTVVPSVLPSVQPTLQPSVLPTLHPTVSPSVLPSLCPTLIPTLAPSELPTLKPTALPSKRPTASPTFKTMPILSSPSYRVSNMMAFAGITASGTVLTWGTSWCGGDSSDMSSLLTSVVEVVSSKFAFAALKSDGSVVAWGDSSAVSGSTVYRSADNIVSLVATEQAFAGITSEGGVIAFGAGCCGGNVDEYGSWSTDYLSSGVKSIAASAGAFCAVKTDGSVYCWGNTFAGGGTSSVSRSDLSDIVLVKATRSAFAGLKSDGSVVSWGNKYFGGVVPSDVSSALSKHTVHIVSSESAFVAYTDTMMLYSWSTAAVGGGAELSEPDGIRYVAHTSSSFAAIRTNGSIVCWGASDLGGDCAAVTDITSVNITNVVGSVGAYVAITDNNTLISWGNTKYGGNETISVSDVKSVHHTSRAFAALRFNGSVVSWGSEHYGGSVDTSFAADLSSDVKIVCSNVVAFTAIRRDGVAVSWGKVSGVLVGNYSSVESC